MAVKHRRLPNGQYLPADNVEDNLNAAATPISVDPVAGGEEELGNEGQHAILMQQLISRGVPPDQARVIAGREVIRRQSVAADERAKARVESGYKDPRQTEYNADTGADGYGFDDAGNPAFLGRVDINNPSKGELRAKGARRYQHRAPYNAEIEAENYGPGSDYAPSDESPQYTDMTVPGPRTLDGKSPTPSRGLTAEEAEAYNTRKPGGLSQRDADMMARGYVPVVTPDGVSYQPSYAANNNNYAIPGGPGRPGPRTGLAKPYLDGKYEMDIAVGPDGVPRAVYSPTPEFREQQKEALAERRKRLAADRNARRAHWQATAMLAGGSQNLNSGNRWIANALVNMEPKDRANAMKYMLPGGQLHAQVDAANAETAAKLASQAVNNMLAENPGTQTLQRDMLQGKRREEAQKWFDDWLYQNHGTGGRGGITVGPYTQDSFDRAVNYMMRFHGLSRAEAEAIAQSQGLPRVAAGASPPGRPMAPSSPDAGSDPGDLPTTTW